MPSINSQRPEIIGSAMDQPDTGRHSVHAWSSKPRTTTARAQSIISESFATAAIALYRALSTIGRYRMSYSEESGYDTCENVFRGTPDRQAAATDFFVSGSGRLVLDGTPVVCNVRLRQREPLPSSGVQAKGYESYGNIFGGISSNYDPAGTYIYTWWSYVDPEGDATATIRSYSRWMHRRNKLSELNDLSCEVVLYSMPTMLTSATW